MEFTTAQLEEITGWGRYNIPPQKMAILLKLQKTDREIFTLEFNNPDSEPRLAWEEGRVRSDIGVMESLQNFAKKEEEGSGEAAKSLGYIKAGQTIGQLKQELFGV